MSIPFSKRAQGCLYLLRHNFDIEETINFVIRECADEPAMQRAADKRKLARNLVTIGGSGDQQQLNLQAFKDALREFEEDRQRNREQEHKREMDALKDDLREANQRAYSSERAYRMLADRATATEDMATPTPESEQETVGV